MSLRSAQPCFQQTSLITCHFILFATCNNFAYPLHTLLEGAAEEDGESTDGGDEHRGLGGGGGLFVIQISISFYEWLFPLLSLFSLLFFPLSSCFPF
jgi:hypothetical protein